MNLTTINVVKHILCNSISNASPKLVFGRTYKSAISLEKLHPKSSLKLTTPVFVPDPNEKFSGFIPMEKLEISYSCSSGPGGQNVNKVKTKVDLRFKLADADWIDPEVRKRLAEEQTSKITKEGYFVMKSDITRYQHLNLADCLRKLRAIVRKAYEGSPEPSPETIEVLRRRHEKAARERLRIKRAQSELQNLKKVNMEDM